MKSKKGELHPRSKDVLRFIVKYKIENGGNSPAYTDIMKACGMTTKSIVVYHLDALAAAGMLDWPRDKTARCISVAGLKVSLDSNSPALAIISDAI